MKTAILKKVTKGKAKGQFAFVLKGVNGQTVANSEPYTQKHSAIETLESVFPDFKIIDKSDEIHIDGIEIVDDLN